MKNILVTGGAGFIGSHVCEALLQRGDSVICIDNFNDYYDPKIKEQNLKNCLTNSNFKLFREDITDLQTLEKIFQENKINKIIHLAARAGVRPSIQQPLLYRESNVDGTLNLLELAKKYNIENFVFGSSSSIYGKNKKIPFSENDTVDFPISPYAASKKACELFCYTYSHLCNLNVTCLRFFTCYGPRGRPDMAPYLFTKLISEDSEIVRYGDGTTQRDYTYVSDIVKGILSALDKNLKFEIINLGNSKPVQLSYFISLIEKNLNKKARIKQLPLQPGDVPVTYADISKAKELLDWQPEISIEEGIKKFIQSLK